MGERMEIRRNDDGTIDEVDGLPTAVRVGRPARWQPPARAVPGVLGVTPLCPNLTPREEQVLLMLGDGLGLREIARDLGLSVWTVRDHRDNGKRKLAATTTTHAVAIMIRLRRAAV